MKAEPEGASSQIAWWRRLSPGGWIALYVLWIILSGKIDAFHLGVGLVAVLFAGWQHSRLSLIEPADIPRLRPWRTLAYFFWLVREMVLAAVYVARVIINPDKHLDPHMIEFRSEQPSLLSSVLLGNSITITPGTLTIDIEDNRYLVHAISPDTADDLLAGGMAARVARLSVDSPIPLPENLSPSSRAES